jgi:hypothetical protein
MNIEILNLLKPPQEGGTKVKRRKIEEMINMNYKTYTHGNVTRKLPG